MEYESRKDKLFKNLEDFLKSEKRTWTVILYKSEVSKLEKYLYEKDIQVESDKKVLNSSKGKFKVTLKKM